MAMTQRIYTINALATEFDMDRRTVAKRLARVPHDGKSKGGFPGWFMKTAHRYLNGDGSGGDEMVFSPDPVKLEKIMRNHGVIFTVGDYDIIHLLNEIRAEAIVMMAKEAPRYAVCVAASYGLTIDQLRSLFNEIAVEMMHLTNDLAEVLEVEWISDDHHDRPVEPDWGKLEERVNG